MSKKKQRNHKTLPTKPISTTIGFYPILIIVALISTVGLLNNYQKIKQQELPQTTKEVSTDQPWKKVVQPNILFSSRAYQDHSTTHVIIPLKFDADPQIVWLTINGNSSPRAIPLLMMHPQLIDLTWQKLDDGIIHLYQRQKKYKSIDEFVNNPPDPEKIAIDTNIKKIDKYSNIAGKTLDETIDVNSVDYLLTTFIKPESKDSVYYYENTFDTSQVALNDNNILWQMNAPQASETNALYVGQINIDYQ